MKRPIYRPRTVLDDWPWLRDLTPGQAWAWLVVHHQVQSRGRPHGCLGRARKTVADWADALDVPTEDLQKALDAGQRHGEVVADDRYWVFPRIQQSVTTDAIRKRTARLLKIQARKGAMPTMPALGQPRFGPKQARAVQAELITIGFGFPRSSCRAVLEALNDLAAAVDDPPKVMIAWAKRHVRKHGPPRLSSDAFFYLRQMVAQARASAALPKAPKH